jgi:hypothetical protein
MKKQKALIKLPKAMRMILLKTITPFNGASHYDNL